MLRFQRSRRRRQIRVKLDEVSRVVGAYFHSGADCALLTSDGELLTAKGVQSRPLDPLVPKIRALCTNAVAISAALGVAPPRTIHVRGGSWMTAVYTLGPHSLVIYAPVPLVVHDSVVRDVDVALSGPSGAGPIIDLADLVRDIV